MGLFSFLFTPSTTAEDAHDRASRREAVILDVRERREWRAGHAPGSKNIPLSTLAERHHELKDDRTYVAVCRSGGRSRSATAQLRAAGFEVLNVKGGMHAWRRAGLPLEPRNGRVL
ncbi:MAG TPA: rhodanese-like domain-containing protein [Gaiellaceae bacterium]|jgi:rhodanese-related sulfurtransferase|nr:rhodanese-like domain-containing protein [Gaiellaceae bacterium]